MPNKKLLFFILLTALSLSTIYTQHAALAQPSEAPVTPPAPPNRPCTTPGDVIPCDNTVNILDYALLSNQFGTNSNESDLNQDGSIDVLDYQILSNFFPFY